MGDEVTYFKQAAAAFIVAGTTLVAAGGLAGGQVVPPLPDPVTDFANYPDPASGAPTGCDASDLVGVGFAHNGVDVGGSIVGLAGMNAGDTITMTWESVSSDCDPEPGNTPSPVSLAMKATPSGFFDQTANQPLVYPWAVAFVTAGEGGSVTLTLPSLVDSPYPGCSGQLDAVVGLPLSVVGPGGSFYGSALRGGGPNMLVSAWNGTYELCAAEVTTTTTPEEDSTTTTVPVTTTSEAPTTTVPVTATTVPEQDSPTTTAPPATTTTPDVTTTAPPAPTSPAAVTPRVTVRSVEGGMPVTGRSIPLVVSGGLALITLGVVGYLLSRRMGRVD